MPEFNLSYPACLCCAMRCRAFEQQLLDALGGSDEKQLTCVDTSTAVC
jgi:hypothetical protein